MDESYANGKPLTEIILEDQSLWPYLQKFTNKQLDIISDLSKYLGIVSQKVEKIAILWEKRLKEARLM